MTLLIGKIRLGMRLRIRVQELIGPEPEPGLYLVELYLPTTQASKASLREALRFGDFDRAVEKALRRDELFRVRVTAFVHIRNGKYLVSPFSSSAIITLARHVNIRNAIVYVRILEKIASLSPMITRRVVTTEKT